MKRRRLSHGRDRKVFSRTAKQHPGNTIRSVMRGGIRK